MPPRSKKAAATSKAASASTSMPASKRAQPKHLVDGNDNGDDDDRDAPSHSTPRQPLGASKSHQLQLPSPSKKADRAAKPKSKAPKSAKPKAAAAAHSEPPGLPEEQIQSFLDNFDLDAEHRIDAARRNLQYSLSSLRRQLVTTVISRLPKSARSLTMREFIDEYGANVQHVVGSAVRRMAQEGIDKGSSLEEGWQKAMREEGAKSTKGKRKGEDEGRTDGKKKSGE